MSLFRSIVFTSILAGIVAGLLVAFAQQFSTVPLILKAEVYEKAAEAAAPPASQEPAVPMSTAHQHAAGEAAHEHDEAAWEPTDGFQRNALSVLAEVLTAIGYALVLTSAYVILGRRMSWREGLLWGLAGFAVFTLAPGLGLPPELPGMPASELGPRQVWWIGTALATAIGIGLVAFKRTAWAAVAGVALIAAPHLIGAPAGLDEATNVPESLWRQFVVAVTLTSFLFWVALGATTGALHQRFARG